jgi:hypothetical protein
MGNPEVENRDLRAGAARFRQIPEKSVLCSAPRAVTVLQRIF